jgi:hypothetical protein
VLRLGPGGLRACGRRRLEQSGRRLRRRLQRGLRSCRRPSRRRGRSRLSRSRAGREQAERVDVTVFVGRDANAEVDVRVPGDRITARARDAHERALCYLVALGDGSAPELEQRDGVAVRRPDRHRAAAFRNRPGERDDARGGSENARPDRCRDIDAAVLAAGIGVAAVGEWTDHRPVHGPGPGECGRRAGLEREKDRKHQAQAHGCLLLVVSVGNEASVARGADVVNRGDGFPTKRSRANRDRDGSAAARSGARRAQPPAGAGSPMRRDPRRRRRRPPRLPRARRLPARRGPARA